MCVAAVAGMVALTDFAAARDSSDGEVAAVLRVIDTALRTVDEAKNGWMLRDLADELQRDGIFAGNLRDPSAVPDGAEIRPAGVADVPVLVHVPRAATSQRLVSDGPLVDLPTPPLAACGYL